MIGFLQLIILGSIGAGVSEFFKKDGNTNLTLLSFGVGLAASGVIVGMYLHFIKKNRKEKK